MRKTMLGLAALATCMATFDASARFLSADPVQAQPETGENFNRYWYANNKTRRR